MAEKDHMPLDPASHRLCIDSDAALSAELKRHRHRRYVQCCGCAAALILIQAVIILILIFTVFRVKDPILKMNTVQIEGLDGVSLTNLNANLTVIADVSVKNPNVAAFKYGNSTTTIYYDGVAVGEGRNPPGVARARRTLRMNMTVDVMLGKVVGISRFSRDLGVGLLPVSSYTSIGGRVKILKIIKRNVVVKMNCTITVNITSQGIQDQSCKKSVSF